MREFSKIKCTIWASKKFGRLNELHKLFYLYLHTNTRVNSCGCYFSPIGYMMHDLSWKEAEIEAALQACVEVGLIRYSANEDTVLIENFFSVNAPQNPKHAIKLLSDIEAIPYPEFKRLCALELKRFVEGSGWKIEGNFLYRIGVVSTLDLDGDLDGDRDNLSVGSAEKWGDDTPTDDTDPPPEEGKPIQSELLATYAMPDGTFENADSLFERFWKNYPSTRDKGSKAKAKEHFLKLLRKGTSYEIIGRGITKYHRYCDTTGEKNADMFRWLRDEGFNRDYAVSPGSPTSGAGSPRNSLAASVNQALGDQTRRPDQYRESLKNLGLDDD